MVCIINMKFDKQNLVGVGNPELTLVEIDGYTDLWNEKPRGLAPRYVTPCYTLNQKFKLITLFRYGEIGITVDCYSTVTGPTPVCGVMRKRI